MPASSSFIPGEAIALSSMSKVSLPKFHLVTQLNPKMTRNPTETFALLPVSLCYAIPRPTQILTQCYYPVTREQSTCTPSVASVPNTLIKNSYSTDPGPSHTSRSIHAAASPPVCAPFSGSRTTHKFTHSFLLLSSLLPISPLKASTKPVRLLERKRTVLWYSQLLATAKPCPRNEHLPSLSVPREFERGRDRDISSP